MKKVFLIIAAAAVVIVAVVLIIVFSMTKGTTETADSFFKAIKDKEYAKAYEFVSEDFKANTSLDELKDYMIHSALMNYKEASWSSRAVENEKGSLEGKVITDKGSEIPVKIAFIKENGDWKILKFEKEDAGFVETNDGKSIPSPRILKTMVNSSVNQLGKAINSKDFSGFYAGISKLWQTQTSKEKLYDIFKVFSEKNIDLTSSMKVEPVLNENPLIDRDGILKLKGNYPSEPPIVYFELKYIYEYPEWKLIGIQVEKK